MIFQIRQPSARRFVLNDDCIMDETAAVCVFLRSDFTLEWVNLWGGISSDLRVARNFHLRPLFQIDQIGTPSPSGYPWISVHNAFST